MTTYTCTECGKKQYTADAHDHKPCIYCGGEVKRVDTGTETGEESPVILRKDQLAMHTV
jgi:DNA-directed RNA polymerase subunit RPC12/RpoP